MSIRAIHQMIPFMAGLGLQISCALAAEGERGFGATVSAPRTHSEVRHWLFVIGIDKYLHCPDLNCGKRDAEAVRDVCLERYNFHPEIIELYDEKATRKGILHKFRELFSRCGPEDSVLIYYAGHGHTNDMGIGYWVPHDGDPKDDSTCVPNGHIKSYLKMRSSRAKHILLVSDSCFAGDLLSQSRSVVSDNRYCMRG